MLALLFLGGWSGIGLLLVETLEFLLQMVDFCGLLLFGRRSVLRRGSLTSVRPRGDIGVFSVCDIDKIRGGEGSFKDYVGIIGEPFTGGGVFGELKDGV